MQAGLDGGGAGGPVAFPSRVLWVTAAVCVLGVALAAPEWLPRGWTSEDGALEWAGFGCFLVAASFAFVAASRTRRIRRQALAAVGLGVVLLVAAGEEISWGQRLLEVETPSVLVDGNRQDELNLHNLEGLQSKAIIGQLAVAGAGAVLPLLVRQRWAWVGLPFFAGYLAYRGGRAVAALAGWGQSGDNAEAAELVLAVGLLLLTAQLVADLGRGGPHPALHLTPTQP